jgi:hypothetical protein
MNPSDWRGQLRSQVRPVLHAATAMTPILTVLLLAVGHGRNHEWLEWLVITPVAIILCFVVSLVAVALLVPPASLALQSRGRNTGVAHAVVGTSLALFLFASYLLGGWLLDDPGSFRLSLREQVALEGVTRAIIKAVVCAVGFALCGALAGYIYWFRRQPVDAPVARDLDPSLPRDPN